MELDEYTYEYIVTSLCIRSFGLLFSDASSEDYKNSGKF